MSLLTINFLLILKHETTGDPSIPGEIQLRFAWKWKPAITFCGDCHPDYFRCLHHFYAFWSWFVFTKFREPFLLVYWCLFIGFYGNQGISGVSGDKDNLPEKEILPSHVSLHKCLRWSKYPLCYCFIICPSAKSVFIAGVPAYANLFCHDCSYDHGDGYAHFHICGSLIGTGILPDFHIFQLQKYSPTWIWVDRFKPLLFRQKYVNGRHRCHCWFSGGKD